MSLPTVQAARRARETTLRRAWPRLLDAIITVSVRTKIMGIVLGLVVLLGIVFTVQVRAVVPDAFQAYLQETGLILETSSAGTAVDDDRIVRLVTQQLLLSYLVVSIMGVAAAVFLTRVITQPLSRLTHAAEAVEQGDYEQRVHPATGDEIGALSTAFNTMTSGLARAETERAERERLLRRLLSAVITAQEEERKRIARELHDESGQGLTSLKVRLRMLGRNCSDPALAGEIAALRHLVSNIMDDLHKLALELRPSVLDDLGLTAALHRYLQGYRQRYAIDVDLIVYGLDDNRLPADKELTLYRIIQEALTNIARHAQAETVGILVECRHGRVRTFIEDDGIGFNPESVRREGEHLGLYGMKERAELLGGSLALESAPGRGTTIFVEVPI